MRITDDPVNHPNAHDDAEIELKSSTPPIKFVDMNDENIFLIVIFVDLAMEKEERLWQQVNRLDSNYFENIVDKKLKKQAYLFYDFDFNKKFRKFSKICIFVFNLKILKIVQADLYLQNLKKINFDIWPY